MRSDTDTSKEPTLRPSDRIDGVGEIDWVKSAISAIGCRKDDPEYLKELFEDAAEARRRINAEYLRDLDEQGKQ